MSNDDREVTSATREDRRTTACRERLVRALRLLSQHLPRWYTRESAAEMWDRWALATRRPKAEWLAIADPEYSPLDVPLVESSARCLQHRLDAYGFGEEGFFHRHFRYLPTGPHEASRTAPFLWANYLPRIDYGGAIDTAAYRKFAVPPPECRETHRRHRFGAVQAGARDLTAEERDVLARETDNAKTSVWRRCALMHGVAPYVRANMTAHALELRDPTERRRDELARLYLRAVADYATEVRRGDVYSPSPITVSPFLCVAFWPNVPLDRFVDTLRHCVHQWSYLLPPRRFTRLFVLELGLAVFRRMRETIVRAEHCDVDELFDAALDVPAIALPLSLFLSTDAVRRKVRTCAGFWPCDAPIVQVMLHREDVLRRAIGAGNSPRSLMFEATLAMYRSHGLWPLLQLTRRYTLPGDLAATLLNFYDLVELEYCEIVGADIATRRAEVRTCPECERYKCRAHLYAPDLFL